MNELIMQTILTMSITGTILALIFFLIKPLIRDRIPKFAQYYSWLIIVIAFLVPFSLLIILPAETNNISTYTVNDAVNQYILPSSAEHLGASDIGSSPALADDKDTNGQMAIPKTTSIFLIIWLIGVIVYISYNLCGYLSFVRKLKRDRSSASYSDIALLTELSNGKRKPALFRSNIAATPMLIGFFKPAIVLPNKFYPEKQLKYIMLHELTHFRRWDILFKWLVVLANALHWFNPMIYQVRRESERMCELSCDEAVIRDSNNDHKQEYGDALIAAAAEKRLPKTVLSTTMSEDKRVLKQRLSSIKNSSKTTKGKVVVSVVLLVLVLFAAVFSGASVNKKAEVVSDTSAAGKNDSWVESFPADLTANGFLPEEITNDLPEFSKEKDSEGQPFYYWHKWDEEKGDVIHKIEMTEQDGVLTSFHYKSYYFDVPYLDSPISMDEASDLVTKFAKQYIPDPESLSFYNKPSNHTLYDPGHVELWFAGSEGRHYIAAVDLDMGSVVYYDSYSDDADAGVEATGIANSNDSFKKPVSRHLF